MNVLYPFTAIGIEMQERHLIYCRLWYGMSWPFSKYILSRVFLKKLKSFLFPWTDQSRCAWQCTGYIDGFSRWKKIKAEVMTYNGILLKLHCQVAVWDSIAHILPSVYLIHTWTLCFSQLKMVSRNMTHVKANSWLLHPRRRKDLCDVSSAQVHRMV